MKTFNGKDLKHFLNQDREEAPQKLLDANINNLNNFKTSGVFDDNLFCIYFLSYRGRVQYIGKTYNLCSRLGNHKKRLDEWKLKKFEFDSVHYIVPKFTRVKFGRKIFSPYFSDSNKFENEIEKIFIKFFEPKWNYSENPRNKKTKNFNQHLLDMRYEMKDISKDFNIALGSRISEKDEFNFELA
jgi:hypothetical protein